MNCLGKLWFERLTQALWQKRWTMRILRALFGLGWALGQRDLAELIAGSQGHSEVK